MPLMLLNLRAMPHGLESHREFLRTEVEAWLTGAAEETDVTFICTGVDTEERSQAVRLAAHQAVLAPVSEVLREMFVLHSCSHVRNMINISIDCDPKVLQSILCLIYNGKTYLSTAAVEKMKGIVKMLGIKFPGGFDRSILAKGSVPPTSNHFRVNGEARARSTSAPRSVSASKRPRDRSQGGGSFGDSPSPAGKKSKPSPGPVKVSATDRMNLHVSMTLQLKDAAAGTSVPCKMPGCGAQVTYDQLKDHFLAHETSAGAGGEAGPGAVSFPCVACGVSFSRRSELDTHTRTKHGQGAVNMKEKLNLLSDSSDDDDSFERVSETTSVKSAAARPRKEPPVCSRCDSVFPSVLHLQAHSCSASHPPASSSRASETNKCDTCFKSFKTNKAMQVHMKASHKGGAGDVKREKISPGKKHQCQICTKRFAEFRQLRTHYTLYHFWDNLEEDYKDWGDTCNICQKRYPTSDHLLQHLGNFHCKIDSYLIRKGLRIVSKEKTAKLQSWRCYICNADQASSSALKSHLSVKHFQKELLAEFPIARGKQVKKCPKCFKVFDNHGVSTVVAHVGSFHDEVIKYAAEGLDLDTADVENVPIDDFDDGTMGVPVPAGAEETRKTPTKTIRKGPQYLCFDVFSYLQCQICQQEFKSSDSLKIHYIRHFQTNFQAQYFSCECPHCDKTFPDIISNQKHVATCHADKSLIPLMESHGLWVNKSVILPADAATRRRIQINVKKLPKSAIQSNLNDIEEAKAQSAPTKHTCAMARCEKVYDSRANYLTHLVISHFWKEISAEFEESFVKDAGTCPVCSANIVNPHGEKMVFFKHLAVKHEVVLKYVETASKETRPAPKLVNRMAPPTPVSGGRGGATPTLTSSPLLRFSNESSGEEETAAAAAARNGHGAAAAAVVVKSEPVAGGEKQSSGRNEDLVNKIRNVFSDDSDSD